MEFLEGFEEDDNPQVLSTSTSSKTATTAPASTGLQALLNPDDHDGHSSNSNGNANTASTEAAQQPASSIFAPPAGLQLSDDDEITITGFSDGRPAQTRPVNGSSSTGQRQQPSSSGHHQQQPNPHINASTDGTSSNSYLARPASDFPATVASTSSATPTTIRLSSTLSHSTSYNAYSGDAYSSNGSNNATNLGRIPIIGGSSGSRAPGTPYGSATFAHGSSIAGAGPYGSSFPYASSQAYALPQSAYGRPPYNGQYAYGQYPPQSPYTSLNSTPQGSSSSSFATSPGAFGMLPGSSSNGYNPSGSHTSLNHRKLDSTTSRNSSSSAVIDLTEHDDNDTGSASNNGSSGKNGTSRSIGGNSTGSDEDEIKISSEKLHLKPTEDGDDELELVGERTNEATNPVCIGQLSGVALILYPIPELCPPREKTLLPATPTQLSMAAPPPLPVALLRTTPNMPNASGNETIKLYSAQTSENFGVVEHRIANVLGPIMTRDNKRGMGVWVEAKVIRTRERSVSNFQSVPGHVERICAY